MTEIRNFLKTMNFTRSAAIFDGAGPLGARIARLAGALVLPVVFSVAAFVSCVPQAFAVEPLIANQARIIGDEARTRIVLDFAEEPEFDIHYLDLARPHRRGLSGGEFCVPRIGSGANRPFLGHSLR